MLYLYDISDMRNVAIKREYELPPIWVNAVMRFSRNITPYGDNAAPTTSLFYADPSARVLLLSAKQSGPNAAGMHWMFINEGFFRPTAYADRRSVPWSYWSNLCLIRELNSNTIIGQPQVVGSRVVYLEKDGTRTSRGHERASLGMIDFAPLAETASPSSAKLWSLIGKQSILKPSETHRDIPSGTTQGLPVQGIRATEDNIVLLLVCLLTAFSFTTVD